MVKSTKATLTLRTQGSSKRIKVPPKVTPVKVRLNYLIHGHYASLRPLLIHTYYIAPVSWSCWRNRRPSLIMWEMEKWWTQHQRRSERTLSVLLPPFFCRMLLQMTTPILLTHGHLCAIIPWTIPRGHITQRRHGCKKTYLPLLLFQSGYKFLTI